MLCELAKLVPYARNARTHSEEQIAQIAASIDEFGFAGAIVIRDGVIAKGHGTVAAARKLIDAGKRIYPPPGRARGAEAFPVGQLPAIDATGWSDAQFRAYVIADNRLALNAGWDFDLLSIELDDLRDLDFDLDLIGLPRQELNDLIGTPNAGPPHGGDDGSSSSSGDGDPENRSMVSPILIELTFPQRKRWREKQKEMGETDDTKAFLKVAGLQEE